VRRKENIMKKIVSLTLSAAMIMGLTACGKAEAPAPAETTAGTAVAATTAAPTAAATKAPETQPVVEAAPPLEEITIWTDNYNESEEAIKLFCGIFEEKTGVKLNWVPFAKEGYADALTAAIMACDDDELPDIIDVSESIFKSLLPQEILLDLTDYIEANDAISALVKNNPAAVQPYNVGDATYGIANRNMETMVVWMRGDLMEDLNLKQPANIEEFEEMLRAIKAAYPDMIPLTAPGKLDEVWNLVANYFGVPTGFVKNADGKLVDYTLTEEYKEFMDTVKRWYADGLIDKEVPTLTAYGTVRDKFTSGQAASVIMWNSNYATLYNAMVKNGIDGTIVGIEPIDNPESGGVFGLTYKGASTAHVMTVGAGDQAQQIFDTLYTWWFTDYDGITTTVFGPEGFTYEVVDGVYNQLATVGNTCQSNPPVDPTYEYPFKLDDVTALSMEQLNYFKNAAIEREFLLRGGTNAGDTEFNSAVSTVKDERQALYYEYIMGNLDYEGFVAGYTAVCDEIDLEGLLADYNK